MGGISDYSGGLVLQWPIAEAAFAAVQLVEEVPRQEDLIEMMSLPSGEGEQARVFSMSRGKFLALADAGYEAARGYFAREAGRHWAAYVAGALLVLVREKGARPEHGLRLLLRSEVPEGKGVSSSAAVEVAAMRSCASALGVSVEGTELAELCQRAENLVAGAPCGIMDQMTSALGKEGQLLALLCQPAEVLGHVSPSSAIGLWGIDSGIRHAVSGSDYTSVRVGAFMGYRILAEGRAAEGRLLEGGVWSFADPPWGGYLANMPLDLFEKELRHALPESLVGAEFVSRYGGTTDPVTRVEPDRVYAVLAPTAHPIREMDRVRRFARLVEEDREESLVKLGQLMFEAHEGYSSCGLGSDGTDRLVELVREAGPSRGLFGAKITGGGSGGTVAVLGWKDAELVVREVARRYAEETGRDVRVFAGTSPGACEVPVIEVEA